MKITAYPRGNSTTVTSCSSIFVIIGCHLLILGSGYLSYRERERGRGRKGEVSSKCCCRGVKIHDSGKNNGGRDTLVAQKWNVSRRNLPRCLFQPLHSPFLSVFSPLKGLILCTQTSRVEGHHQVTPTRPPRICHFGILPETLVLSRLS